MDTMTRWQLDMKVVRQTISVLLGLPENRVLDANGETDVSELPYFVTVGIVTSEALGEEYRFDAREEQEILTASRQTIVAVNAYGQNAYLIIEKLYTLLSTSYATQHFSYLGIGILKKSQVRNLPTAISGGKEQRAQIDLTLSHIHRISTPMTHGKSVDIKLKKD